MNGKADLVMSISNKNSQIERLIFSTILSDFYNKLLASQRSGGGGLLLIPQLPQR